MKKIFIVTIPKRNREGMNDISYIVHGKNEYVTEPGIFPSLTAIEKAASGDCDIKIAAVMTEDNSGNSERNLKEFQEKLAELSAKTGKKIEICSTVKAMNDETRVKQIALFRDICRIYEDDCEVHIDVTYGTKVTSLVLMCTLSYAEKIKNCEIKSVIYANAFGKSEDRMMGDIYDVRCLYELSMFMNSLSDLPNDSAEGMIEELWR